MRGHPEIRDKEKRGEKNCRKYATEMKNEKSPLRIRHRGEENVASLSDAEDEGRGGERRESGISNPPRLADTKGEMPNEGREIGGYKKRSSSNELLPFDKVLTLIIQRLS